MSIYWNNYVLRCVTLKSTEWNIDCFVGTVIMRFLSPNLTIIGLLLCKWRYYLKKKKRRGKTDPRGSHLSILKAMLSILFNMKIFFFFNSLEMLISLFFHPCFLRECFLFSPGSRWGVVGFVYFPVSYGFL